MNQDEDTTIQKLTPGTWHGRVIRNEHNEVPGQIILIEDREYFFQENNPSFFFKQKTAYEMSASLVGSEMCIRVSCKGFASNALQHTWKDRV